MQLNNGSDYLFNPQSQSQCQNPDQGGVQSILSIVFSQQNIIAILIFIIGYLFGRRKRSNPEQMEQPQQQQKINNTENDLNSESSQQGKNQANKVKNEISIDSFSGQDTYNLNFSDQNNFSQRGVIESRKYSNHSAGNWNDDLSSANSDMSFQNNDHAFQNGHKYSYLEDQFDQNNPSSSDAVKQNKPKQQEEQVNSNSQQQQQQNVTNAQQQQEQLQKQESEHNSTSNKSNPYSNELALVPFNNNNNFNLLYNIQNNFNNNNNNNNINNNNNNNNNINNQNQCIVDFNSKKFSNDDISGRQQRKLLSEIGNALVRKKSKNSNLYGLSEESEEEIFFEQCTFKNAPLRKQADFKIEFEKDDAKGVYRKIETHQVITDYVQTKETHKELEDIKSTFQQNLQINNNQEIKGFKISHVKQNLNMIPLIDKIQSQKSISNISPTEDRLVSVQNLQFNSFEKDQQLALYQNPFKVETRIAPLFEQSHLNNYLDNGKFNKFYKALEELGRGGFGRVYKVQSMVEEKIYAIKKIAVPYDGISNPKEHKYFREVKSIMSLNHVNIVRYHTSWWESCDDEMVNQVNEFLQTNNNLYSAENSPSVSASYQKNGGNLKSNMHSKQTGNVTQSFALSYNNDVSCLEWEQSEDQNQDSYSNDEKQTSQDDTKTVQEFQKQNQSNKTFNITKEPQLLTLYIQLEYCSGKTLRNYLDEQTHGLDTKESFSLFSQMLEGVNYLHQNGIIHRDLKPSNILFENKTVKIGDFGLSIKQELGLINSKQLDFPSHHNFDGNDNIDSPIYTSNVGTPFYMPPEQADKFGKYNEKIDVYSLGIILLEMIHKMDTYHEKLEVVKKLKSFSQLPQNLLKTQKYACELVISMTSLKPQNRPSIESILQGKTYLSWKKKVFGLDKQY